MDEPVPSPSPEDERVGRRGLFAGRPTKTSTDVPKGAGPRVDELLTAYQATIQRQLEDGLRRIQTTASTLMHEIAAEVWRTAGGDKDEVRGRILHELSRDQALRGLIAHADERFQALAIRTERLEETLNHLADSMRGAREHLSEGAGILDRAAVAGDPNEVRRQLADVTRQVAAALSTLAERDEAIVETVHVRVRENGELITRETTRISAAMEAYVQQGVEAIGRLAGSVDRQLETLTARDDHAADRIAEAVEQQMSMLGEQMQLLFDRLAIDTTSLGEYLHVLNERIDVANREAIGELQRTLETRVLGLAKLVRSDSETLRRELVETAQTLDENVARALDERLAEVTEAVGQGTARMLEDLGRRVQEETGIAIRAWIDDALARLQAQVDEQSRHLDGRTDEALSAIDRNMVRMTDAIEIQFERLGRAIGERTAQAAEVAIGERFDDVLARLHEAAGTVEQVQRTIRQGDQEMEQALDGRLSSLAKLIRSDNETLAQQIVADQEATKQSLRVMKELQANLPGEVINMVEQRFASLAESIERSNEMLAKRIDKMAVKIGQRYDNDIQVVVDRMGDAMHALASLGRPASGGSAQRGPEPRIELD
jgi:hypothetical protein